MSLDHTYPYITRKRNKGICEEERCGQSAYAVLYDGDGLFIWRYCREHYKKHHTYGERVRYLKKKRNPRMKS